MNCSVLYVIDVSNNSSEKLVRRYLGENISDYDNIAIFDDNFCFYTNKEELLDELDNFPDVFFCNPASYYDSIVSILSRIRKCNYSEIVIYSPEIDDCSQLYDNESFEQYIHHYTKWFGEIYFEEYQLGFLSTYHKEGRKHSLITWIKSLFEDNDLLDYY